MYTTPAKRNPNPNVFVTEFIRSVSNDFVFFELMEYPDLTSEDKKNLAKGISQGSVKAFRQLEKALQGSPPSMFPNENFTGFQAWRTGLIKLDTPITYSKTLEFSWKQPVTIKGVIQDFVDTIIKEFSSVTQEPTVRLRNFLYSAIYNKKIAKGIARLCFLNFIGTVLENSLEMRPFNERKIFNKIQDNPALVERVFPESYYFQDLIPELFDRLYFVSVSPNLLIHIQENTHSLKVKLNARVEITNLH